jgi:c(7)-type cytochrome triheme protein
MKRLALILIVVAFTLDVYASGFWDLPPLPPPEQYGNLLINRLSEKKGERPVTFSHWSHRVHYTCRVCHFELDFQMKVNTTEITEDANRKGRFCGACHNGKIAFGHTEENCKKCHNGDITYGKEKFEGLSKTLPPSKYGNKIDWTRAIETGKIKPKQTIFDEPYEPMPFKKKLRLEAEWSMVPPAYFSHEKHNYWLDCANCHPDIFNIKKKTTKHFSMVYILDGKFCGACHLRVAFPIDDCRGCHPDITTKY